MNRASQETMHQMNPFIRKARQKVDGFIRRAIEKETMKKRKRKIMKILLLVDKKSYKKRGIITKISELSYTNQETKRWTAPLQIKVIRILLELQ